MTYRKRGSVVRWENGTLVRVTECGVAIEEGDVFRCAPESASPESSSSESSSRRVVESSRDAVIEIVDRIRTLVQGPLSIERLIVSHGVAEHECEGREWREESQRIHLEIRNDHLRVLIDLGDSTTRRLGARRLDDSTTRRLDDSSPGDSTTRLGDTIEALARSETAERPAPARLRLAPNVTAALLPALVGLAPPNVRLVQTAGGVDGYGNPIVEAEGEPWPNWYRPSYRVRPVRMPLNLRLQCDVTEMDRDRPMAVALLAPVAGPVLHVLVVDGARVYPATVRVARIDAVASEREWYPYGGGSFGAELML